MARFIEGKDRRQTLLLPECLDDYVTQDNPVRVIAAFIDELDLQALGFTRARPAATGRPAYHPAILLKIYLDLLRKGYCWRIHHAGMGAIMSLVKADCRVRVSGVPANQAPSRMRFMAAAVSTCCRCVFASPM